MIEAYKLLASSWELLSWVKRTLKGSWPTFQFLLSVAPQRFDRLIRKVCQDAPMVQLKDIRKELKYGFSNVEMAFQFINGLYHSSSALHLLSIALENFATKKNNTLFQCKKNQVLNLYTMVFSKLYTNYLPTLSLSHLFCSCCITFCISDREFTFEFSNEKCTNVIGLFLHSKEGTIF